MATEQLREFYIRESKISFVRFKQKINIGLTNKYKGEEWQVVEVVRFEEASLKDNQGHLAVVKCKKNG